jgi:hypothetical protein
VSTQHIGAAGELLVQYQRLKLEIDSARLTTDSGVDLVVYSPADGRATTVQVKTMRAPVPAGGRGRSAVGWPFPHDCPAAILALTLLSLDQVWIFTLDEARTLAQQHTENGRRRLYWYMDDETRQVDGVPKKIGDMISYRLENRAQFMFPAKT